MNNEEQMRRVQERLDQIEVELSERRMVLRQEIQTIASREDAITLATRTAAIGSIPSIIWIIWAVISKTDAGLTAVFNLYLGLLCVIILLMLMVFAAGTVSGMFAHWWFANSMIPVNRAAIATAVVADAVLFGWVLAISYW